MASIALLSDIHGNLPALEAVIADLQAISPDAIYVLGDMVNGCPWSAQALDRLADLGWPMLMGNHDDAVLQIDTPRMEPRYADRQRYGLLWLTHRQLTRFHHDLLAQLPRERRLDLPDCPPLRLLHGVPGSFYMGIRPDTPEAWAADQLAPVVESGVACGHTHVPMVRRVGRWTVINAGSVAAPYDGDRRASYALLRCDAQVWHVVIRRVAYDWDAVDAGFRAADILDEGGVMAELFRRSVLTALPWVSDFAWYIRGQPAEVSLDMPGALASYDALHGPGRWAFPFA